MMNAAVDMAVLAIFAIVEVNLWWDVVAGPRSRRLRALFYAILALLCFAYTTYTSWTFVQAGMLSGRYGSEPAPWFMVCGVGALLVLTGIPISNRISEVRQRWRRQEREL